MVFEIGNDMEIEGIYKEYGMGLSYDEWLEVYDACTDEEYGFLFINLQRPKRKRMMKNLEVEFTHVPDRNKRKAGESEMEGVTKVKLS